MKTLNLAIYFLTICAYSLGQPKSESIKFNSPCFKTVNRTSKFIKNKLVAGYDCEFIFIPQVYTTSTKTGNKYYRDWWNFFIVKQKGYIDIYPLTGNNTDAHVTINQYSNLKKEVYQGKTETIHRRDFDSKYETDDWVCDTTSQAIKIFHDKTFRYGSELITLINIEGWDLYVPKKCKTLEGYCLLFSNKRGFVGSYIYFFSPTNSIKPTSYSFTGDKKLQKYMSKREMIYYFGQGIWWECDR